MLYITLKVLHLSVMIIWISGMVSVALNLYLQRDVYSLRTLRLIDRCVIAPAMLCTWGFGILLVYNTGLLGAGWLTLKIILVIVLSGIHGVLSGLLRKAAETKGVNSSTYAYRARNSVLVILTIVIIIITLAVTKLF